MQYNYKKKTSAARLEALKLTPEIDDSRFAGTDSSLGSKVSSTSCDSVTTAKSQNKLQNALLKQALEGNRVQETSKDIDRPQQQQHQQQPNTHQSSASPESQQQDIWFPSASESTSATALFNIAPYFSSPNAIEAFKTSMISPSPHFTPTVHPIFSE